MASRSRYVNTFPHRFPSPARHVSRSGLIPPTLPRAAGERRRRLGRLAAVPIYRVKLADDGELHRVAQSVLHVCGCDLPGRARRLAIAIQRLRSAAVVPAR